MRDRTFRTNVFRELGMSHRKDTEDKSPVKVIIKLVQGRLPVHCSLLQFPVIEQFSLTGRIQVAGSNRGWISLLPIGGSGIGVG